MARARARAKIAFEPDINIALNNSQVAGDDQAAGDSVLLDDSQIRQRQRFTESGPGDQTIAQTEVQEEVVDPG